MSQCVLGWLCRRVVKGLGGPGDHTRQKPPFFWVFMLECRSSTSRQPFQTSHPCGQLPPAYTGLGHIFFLPIKRNSKPIVKRITYKMRCRSEKGNWENNERMGLQKHGRFLERVWNKRKGVGNHRSPSKRHSQRLFLRRIIPTPICR